MTEKTAHNMRFGIMAADGTQYQLFVRHLSAVTARPNAIEQ